MSPSAQSSLVDALAVAALGGCSLHADEVFTARVLERADELSVFALFAGRAKQHGHSLRGAAKQRWRDHGAGVALVHHQLAVAEGALSSVEHLILKGEPLSRRIFRDALARQVTDIDILVRPADVPRVVELLSQVGWSAGAERRPEPWVNNQFPLAHPTLAIVAEVHWALALPRLPSPEVDELLARAVEVDIGGMRVRVLDPEMGFLYACYHFHHHVGFLKGLFDIAAWLDSHGEQIDFGCVEQRARGLGVLGMVLWPLRALQQLTQLDTPLSRCRADLWVRAWARWTARATHGVLARDRPIMGSELLAFKTHDLLRGHAAAWNMLGMTVVDGTWAKARGALQPIMRSPSAMAAAAGRDHTTAADYLRVASRPATLVIKQVADVVRGRSKR